jgi:2'-5' RNA ligase
MSQFRGFIAVDISVIPKIFEFEKEIKNSDANVKLVEPENIHITLKFLGDTDEQLIDDIREIIKSSTEEIKPFNIQLTGTGVFPNPNYIRVVWIGIENYEQIEIIAKKIDDKILELGFEKERRGFSPHLTIARVRSAKNKDKLLQVVEKYKETVFADIKVESVKLMKSDLTPKGPIYTTLKEVKI